MKSLDLRKKYPKFIFEKYDWNIEDGQLVVRYYYQTPPDHNFIHTLIFKNLPLDNIKNLSALLFQIGLSEMPSYWKATASPTIEVQCGHLNLEQTQFWHKLFIRGMGQYFYENQIDFTAPDFLTINSFGQPTTINDHRMTINDHVLVPIGGGKDSLVTLELLKKNFPVTPFIINPIPSVLQLCQIASTPPPITGNRTIDPYLRKLTQQGYLNGHVPLNAVIAFISVFVAAASQNKYVAISNERSSNEVNTTYLNTDINHQYSKTLEFETDLNTYLSPLTSVKYFSFLRPLYEIQITKIFSHYPQYFNNFTSCNKNFKIDSQQHPKGSLWCKNCPKCVSLALLLIPWIGKAKVTQIMGGYPPDMPGNQEILKELRGEKPVKPFECVLTRAEALGTVDLNSWQDNPNMPPEFTNILRQAYDHS